MIKTLVWALVALVVCSAMQLAFVYAMIVSLVAAAVGYMKS